MEKIYSANLDWFSTEKLGEIFNFIIAKGYTKDQALASAVFNICGWAVKSIEEVRDAFDKGMDIEFNIGTGVMGNVINIIYSPKNKRFEEPLFDLPTLQKLGYGLSDILATLGNIAGSEKLHYKSFECVNG